MVYIGLTLLGGLCIGVVTFFSNVPGSPQSFLALVMPRDKGGGGIQTEEGGRSLEEVPGWSTSQEMASNQEESLRRPRANSEPLPTPSPLVKEEESVIEEHPVEAKDDSKVSQSSSPLINTTSPEPSKEDLFREARKLLIRRQIMKNIFGMKHEEGETKKVNLVILGHKQKTNDDEEEVKLEEPQVNGQGRKEHSDLTKDIVKDQRTFEEEDHEEEHSDEDRNKNGHRQRLGVRFIVLGSNKRGEVIHHPKPQEAASEPNQPHRSRDFEDNQLQSVVGNDKHEGDSGTQNTVAQRSEQECPGCRNQFSRRNNQCHCFMHEHEQNERHGMRCHKQHANQRSCCCKQQCCDDCGRRFYGQRRCPCWANQPNECSCRQHWQQVFYNPMNGQCEYGCYSHPHNHMMCQWNRGCCGHQHDQMRCQCGRGCCIHQHNQMRSQCDCCCCCHQPNQMRCHCNGGFCCHHHNQMRGGCNCGCCCHHHNQMRSQCDCGCCFQEHNRMRSHCNRGCCCCRCNHMGNCHDCHQNYNSPCSSQRSMMWVPMMD